MVDIQKHYAEKSSAFAGLAELYANKDAGNNILNRHIFVATALSDAYLIKSTAGDEGEATAFRVFGETLDEYSPHSTVTNPTVGDVVGTFREKMNTFGNYNFFYLSDNVWEHPFHYGDTSNSTAEQFEHVKEDEEALKDRWEAAVNDAHEKIEQSDMWGVVSAMYNADVAAFQLWVTEYSRLISTQLQLLSHPDDISGVYYDVLWTFGLETLKGLGEIPDDDLESALNMWRSRLVWVAGWDNSRTLIDYFNGNFTPALELSTQR